MAKRWLGLLLIAFALLLPGAARASQVKIIKLTGEVTMAAATYLATEIESADRNRYAGIVIQIDAHDGMALAAERIISAMDQSRVPCHAWISGEAHGAAALVALAADRLYMAPFASVGDARTLPDTDAVRSALVAMAHACAIDHGRDADVATSMVTERRVLTEFEAAQARITQGMGDNIAQVLVLAGFAGLDNDIVPPDLVTVVAGILSQPGLSTGLFVIGICLLLFEIFGAGLGLPGLLGLACLALYYGGGLLAGYAQVWAVALFGASVLLFLLEALTPGFGAFGIVGIVALAASVYFNARSLTHFLITAGAASVGVGITLPIVVRRFFRGTRAPGEAFMSQSMVPDGHKSDQEVG